MAGFLEPLAELAAGGRFAGALESSHENDGWRLRGGFELGVVAAKEVDELVGDDFDDLFGGAESGGDAAAHGLGADVLDERINDGEVDVGFDEGEADLGHGVGDVFVGDGALATKVLEGALELVGEVFKHNFGLRYQFISGAGRSLGGGEFEAGKGGSRVWVEAAGWTGNGDIWGMTPNEKIAGNARMVREYCDYLRVERGLRPASCAAYALDLEQFAEHVETRDGVLMTAVQADVSGFMERLRGNGVESRSIARKLSGLRGFYRWLLMDKKIGYDPTVNIETPASWKVLPKSLAESEVAEMLERTGVAARAADADALSLRDHAILELLYAGGLRVGEICALREEGPASRSGAGAGKREGAIRSGSCRWERRQWRRSRSICRGEDLDLLRLGCSGHCFLARMGMR